MKRLSLFLLLFVAVFVACSRSNEEKATALVAEYLHSTLPYPSSYEPISTRVDSMFYDVSKIEPILKCSHEIQSLLGMIEYYKIDAKYFDNEDTHYFIEKYSKELHDEIESLKDNVSALYCYDYMGWLVVHRYNALNEYGLTPIIPNETVFICNKELTSCYTIDNGQYIELRDVLQIVDKSSTNNEITDNFKSEFVIIPQP